MMCFSTDFFWGKGAFILSYLLECVGLRLLSNLRSLQPHVFEYFRPPLLLWASDDIQLLKLLFLFTDPRISVRLLNLLSAWCLHYFVFMFIGFILCELHSK